MATPLDGIVTQPQSKLIKWLQSNNSDHKKLIEILHDEEIESVDDLLILDTDKEFKTLKSILVGKIKLGKISKLIKALNKYRTKQLLQNNHIGNKALDKNEQESIQMLSSKLSQIESALKALPTYNHKLSLSKETMKKEIDNICNSWIKLIHKHKQSLYKMIQNIENIEIQKNKLLNSKLVTDTKLKCQNLISDASINDIWNTNNKEQTDITSLVRNCVSKLDQKLNRNNFNAEGLISKNNNFPTLKDPLLLVNVVQNDKVEFVVEDDLCLYDSRELFIKTVDAKLNNDDEKKSDNYETINLPIVDNKNLINIKELDSKLGKHSNYVAYIVDNVGNIKNKRQQVHFTVVRTGNGIQVQTSKGAMNDALKLNNQTNVNLASHNNQLMLLLSEMHSSVKLEKELTAEKEKRISILQTQYHEAQIEITELKNQINNHHSLETIIKSLTHNNNNHDQSLSQIGAINAANWSTTVQIGDHPTNNQQNNDNNDNIDDLHTNDNNNQPQDHTVVKSVDWLVNNKDDDKQQAQDQKNDDTVSKKEQNDNSTFFWTPKENKRIQPTDNNDNANESFHFGRFTATNDGGLFNWGVDKNKGFAATNDGGGWAWSTSDNDNDNRKDPFGEFIHKNGWSWGSVLPKSDQLQNDNNSNSYNQNDKLQNNDNTIATFRFEPIAQLKGHENEALLDSFGIIKLYRWSKDVSGKSEWKPRAENTTLDFYQDNNSGKIRVVLRENLTAKLRLNQWISHPDLLRLAKKKKNMIYWEGLDDTNTICGFLAEFKTEVIAIDAYKMFENSSENNQQPDRIKMTQNVF